LKLHTQQKQTLALLSAAVSLASFPFRNS
jgi:hypothetical protein